MRLGGRALDFCNTNLLTGLFVQESAVRFPVGAYLVLEPSLYLRLFQIPGFSVEESVEFK